MALLNTLMVRIGVASDGVRRGVNRANRELNRMRDHARRISRHMGRSGSDGGREFSEGFWRDAIGRLRDFRGRFARSGRELGDSTGLGFARGFLRRISNAFRSIPKIMRAAAPVAAIGSAFITLIPVLINVATWIGNVWSAALAATPAFLALGAAGLAVFLGFRGIFAEGSKAREALSGLGEMFSKAAEAGSEAAARGVKPLVEQLRRVAQPHVTKFMQGLGESVNTVQIGFFRWAQSAEGVRVLQSILEPVSQMMRDLAPHVTRLVISFSQMLGRIMGVSTAMGTSGLAGALDWLSKKMDGVDADTVSDGLSRLATAGRQVASVVSTVAGWIRTLVQAYRMYTTEFRLVADALSIAAIAFGGPIVATIGVISLLIRHFDKIKAAWESLKAAFQSGGAGGPIGKAFDDLKAAAATVTPALKNAFALIKSEVLPSLQQLGSQIKNDVIPTIAEFARAFAPIVAWLIGVLGPVVATVFKSVVDQIRGALNVVSGLIKIVTGIITGDWRKCWQGVKQIAKGLWQSVSGLFRAGVALVKGILKGLIGIQLAIWRRLASVAKRGGSWVKNAVVGAFRAAGSWLRNAGRAIIDGLVSGIQGAIGKVKSALGKVTSMIPSWKGPMRVDLKLLEPTGRAIMTGLTSGINHALPDLRRTLQGVTHAIPGYAAPRGVAQTARRESPPEIVIRSGGSRIDDALVELLRKAIKDKGGDVQKVLGR